MYMVYAQSGPARLGMRSAETFEEAREKADQTARELSDRLSAPYEDSYPPEKNERATS